jgi:hypothetical protein
MRDEMISCARIYHYFNNLAEIGERRITSLLSRLTETPGNVHNPNKQSSLWRDVGRSVFYVSLVFTVIYKKRVIRGEIL